MLLGEEGEGFSNSSNSLFLFFDEPRKNVFDLVKEVAKIIKNNNVQIEPAITGPPPMPGLVGDIGVWISKVDRKEYNDVLRKQRQEKGDLFV